MHGPLVQYINTSTKKRGSTGVLRKDGKMEVLPSSTDPDHISLLLEIDLQLLQLEKGKYLLVSHAS